MHEADDPKARMRQCSVEVDERVEDSDAPEVSVCLVRHRPGDGDEQVRVIHHGNLRGKGDGDHHFSHGWCVIKTMPMSVAGTFLGSADKKTLPG